MFLLGILSLSQIIVLPGLIATKLLKIKTENPLQLFLYSFGLSLYINYPIVCLLTLFKIYTAGTIYILFIIELIILYRIYFRHGTGSFWKKSIRDCYLTFVNYLGTLSPIRKLVFMFSCVCVLFFISFIPINSSIFYFSDAIYSWNRWAVDWASNKFPYDTAHYPQLFSANMSLCYVFTQNTSLQFFPKVIMPLFPIGILLMFLDLSLIRKSIIHLTGLIIYTCILLIFYSLLFISDFNADIPTSFLGFLVFYTIVRHTGLHENIYPGSQVVLLIVIFASSAANTKMAGIYILAASLMWIAFKIYKAQSNLTKVEMIKSVVYILIVLAISSFWYLVKPVDMFNGLNQSPYLPSSYYERFTNAIRMLFFSFGPAFSLFLLFTVLFSLFNNDSKYIVITIIAPVLLMWIFFFSYDFRNLSIAVPFIAYASAYGLEFICKRVLYLSEDKTPKQIKESFAAKGLLGNTQARRVLFILLAVSIILIVNTNAFFNFGINLSYFFYKIYFRYYRIVYTFEHGYYKYVEYFAGALGILSGLLLALFVFRKSAIKILHIVIFIAVSAAVLNFTFLTKEKLFSRQKYDTEMLTAHNLYYRIHAYLNSINTSIQIISNYKSLNEIIFPQGISLKYSPNINHEILYKREDKRYTNYLLLEKKLLNETILKRIEQNLADSHSAIQFNDDKFLFTKL